MTGTKTDRASISPVDGVVAVVAGVLQVAGVSLAARHQVGPPLDALAYALLAAGPLALVVRRRYPVAVLAATSVFAILYFLLGYPPGPAVLAAVVALYTAVVEGHRTAAFVAVAAAVAHAGFEYALGELGVAGIVAVPSWGLLVIGVGEVVRVRREYVRAVEQRAAEAERTREEEARRRASDERLRIARELHDVLAHNISLINVQAGVALHLIDERPEQARSALGAIKDASKDTLRELRSVLGALRGVDEDPPRSPAASLRRLDDLVSRAEAAGVRVDLVVTGEARPLPAGVDLAAYRIVQEALTNVSRHADARIATVRVTYGERDLEVVVTDDGRGPKAPGSADGGSGIPGMRERAAALGGELEAGPRPDGGFRVRAYLPLDDDAVGRVEGDA